MIRKYNNKEGGLSARERELCARHAEMCRVFAHPTRLAVLCVLREEGELPVTRLAQTLALGMGNLSQHLSMMKERRILESRKAGNQVFYRVADGRLLKAFDLLTEILLGQLEKESRLLSGRPGPARGKK